MLQQLFDRLREIYPRLVEIRRDLHMYPEISFEEVETPKKIARFLTELGLEVRTGVGGRGVVGILRGEKPGKTVALRADFDALPIQDEKEVPYRSRIPGKMHACGHDLHTAALLGVAAVLSEVKEQLAGTVVFIHQFAEELAPGGAKPMIEDGCLDGVDVIYGAHVWAGLPYGTVGFCEGYAMAAADAFEIEVTGRGGHGAQPHLTVDPLVTASQLVVNLQNIVSRRVDPLKSAVVTVGSFHSGEAFNVIPHSAHLKGTVRTFDEDVRSMVEEWIGQVVKGTCEQMGATAKYEYRRGYPALYNHVEETRRVKRLAEQLFGTGKVTNMEPVMGGEDFAYYLQKVPGTFFFVGGGNPELDAVYPHHHPKFDVDERAMLVIGQLFITAVLDYWADGKLKVEESLNRFKAQ
ncbi:amidohydrolase [Caldalkalibacillus thermarum TA2.A1]|uniref:Amidohydrolase n=1 Tax=Caldalkalibacillus thermarum (strain TA2.A1) TaxID=986075 RepID=F5L775_CALTT|nr:amidohydrolase [Caldalkalibacillus thermarum]EGL82796.1 amidohydrolase [Caldalkalibacillus thermarum TA2.A1]QZT34769.1 amidohydrolase [Caldalkalibacillus thermarum TA2.A1]